MERVNVIKDICQNLNLTQIENSWIKTLGNYLNITELPGGDDYEQRVFTAAISNSDVTIPASSIDFYGVLTQNASSSILDATQLTFVGGIELKGSGVNAKAILNTPRFILRGYVSQSGTGVPTWITKILNRENGVQGNEGPVINTFPNVGGQPVWTRDNVGYYRLEWVSNPNNQILNLEKTHITVNIVDNQFRAMNIHTEVRFTLDGIIVRTTQFDGSTTTDPYGNTQLAEIPRDLNGNFYIELAVYGN